jgi:cytochrome c oxidase subunit 2
MDEHNLSIFSPVSPPAESIRVLSVLVFVITGLIFLVVEGMLIYLIVRSRRRAVDDTTEPPQIYGSQPIEVAWTAAPALIVFILTLVTTRSLWEIRADPPRPREGSPALFVTVIGHQWWWEYRYDDYEGKSLGFIAANELHVPASDDETDRPIYLTLKSADVCHSFWVPRLAGKTDLIPGRVTSMWFQTKEKGCSWASAPSIAGPSTRICCSGSSSTRRPTSRDGWRISGSRRSRSRPPAGARPPSCPNRA